MVNKTVRQLKEELQKLQEPGSHVGEIVKQMGQSKVLVKMHPDGKYIVDIDKDIKIQDCKPLSLHHLFAFFYFFIFYFLLLLLPKSQSKKRKIAIPSQKNKK